MTITAKMVIKAALKRGLRRRRTRSARVTASAVLKAAAVRGLASKWEEGVSPLPADADSAALKPPLE